MRGRPTLLLVLAAAAAAGPGAAAAAAADRVELISRQGDVPGDAASSDPSISADGRFVAFTSEATNLGVVERVGTGFATDVVLHDRSSGTTQLASPAARPQDDDFSSDHPRLSGSGRVLAFLSDGRFAVDDRDRPGDTDGTDVYVRDLRTGAVQLVSRASGARGDNGPGYAFEPAISASGRFVAFTSPDPLLAPGRRPMTRAYVRDLRTQRLVALPPGPRGRGRLLGFSRLSLSADGRTAASTVLYARREDGPREVRVVRHDLRSRRTTLVDRYHVGPTTLFRFVTGTSLSGDGRLLAYADLGGTRRRPTRTPVGARVVLADRATGRSRVLARRATAPVLSANGRSVAFKDLTFEEPALTFRPLASRRRRPVTAYSAAFTRDGRQVVHDVNPTGETRQVVLDRLR